MNRRTAAKLLVAVALLAVVLSRVDLGGVQVAAASIQPGWLVVIIPLQILALLLSARIWQVTVRAQGYETPYRQLVVYYYITQFYSTFLPGSYGGDGARAYYFHRDHPGESGGVASIVTERLTGLVTVVAIGSVGLALAPEQVGPWPNWLLGTSLLIGLTAGVVAVRAGFLTPVLSRVVFPLPKVGTAIEHVYTATLDYETATVARAAGWSLAFRASAVALNAALGLAVGLDVALGWYVVLVPVIELLLALPVTIQGIGVREAAYVSLFAAVGGEPAAALLLALGVYASNIVLNSGLGGLVYLGYQAGWLAPEVA